MSKKSKGNKRKTRGSYAAKWERIKESMDAFRVRNQLVKRKRDQK